MLHETATSFTFLDFIMIGTVTLSGIFGFFRGFTREVLTIGGWILATFTTLYGMDFVKPLIKELIGGPAFVADVVTILGVFILSLILFSLIIRFISDKVKASGMGSLDRSLGLVFGGVRGVFILAVFLGLAVYIWPKPENRPSVMQQARLVPLLSKGTAWILNILPQGLVDTKHIEALQLTKSRSSEEIVQSLAHPQAGLLKRSGQHGYSAEARQKIEDLFIEDSKKNTNEG